MPGHHHALLHAGFVDYLIIAVYFLFVLAIGALVSRRMKTSEDFFLSGRSIPAWVTGLAFISANLGALEVLGMSAQGAEYGMMTAHFYWIGAIPAMLFLGVFMMPFYYGSKVRSVPEYLQKRYNESTRAVNAITFAVSTLILSGVSMYGMGLVFHDLLNWNLELTIVLSAVVVLLYTFAGGLTSSIYNEVLQFFLIVLGIMPLVIVGILAAGGWGHLTHQLPPDFQHTWKGTGTTHNAMQITWPGVVLGLGFVLSFGYWCTDFLVIQRALAAKDMNAAQRTPLIAAIPKIFFPFLVILPGLIALPLFPMLGHNTTLHPENSYNNALPLLMGHYYPAGMLGLGLTALLASFMSGMAGNTTAFNTVFTYDLYQAYFVKNREDSHYLKVGRVATVLGVVISIGTAFLAAHSKSIMDFTQTVFGFVNAPLLGTFLFGMFWKRTTPWGGFWGLIAGIVAAFVHWWATVHSVFGIHFVYHTDQAGNFWRAFIAFAVGAAATYLVSLVTTPKPVEELRGLVYSETPRQASDAHLPWHQRPLIFALIVLAVAIVVNLFFW
jgi:SSS family solute:Na+ symporter